MRYYERTEWYGFNYLLLCAASVLPKCLPFTIVSAVIAYLSGAGTIDRIFEQWGVDLNLDDLFGDPFSVRFFGVVIGFLSVGRLKISYNRYWEGVREIKTMHSVWASCCGALIQFDQVGNPKAELWDEPYCVYMVRLFSQLSAMAMMKLHLADDREVRRVTTHSSCVHRLSLSRHTLL